MQDERQKHTLNFGIGRLMTMNPEELKKLSFDNADIAAIYQYNPTREWPPHVTRRLTGGKKVRPPLDKDPLVWESGGRLEDTSFENAVKIFEENRFKQKSL